ncbi:MAG TPA: FAD/NAD(P)-binding protein [bacterium]
MEAARVESPLAALAEAMVPVPYRVLRRTREAAGVVTLELAPADGGAALKFAPGQFTMVYRFGVGEIPLSISGDPNQPHLVHTIRDVGTVSHALSELRRGDVVGVRGPFGSPWPVVITRGYDLLVIAGGLGLAPVRPILYHVLNDRASYGHVNLLCGSRSLKDLPFKQELEKWRARLDLDVRVTVDRADLTWRGPVGVVTKLIDKATFAPDQTVAFVCGPEVMMRFTARELTRIGVGAEHIYLSIERNMQCAIGLCGHCQLGPVFVCKDGPVFPLSAIEPWLKRREV